MSRKEEEDTVECHYNGSTFLIPARVFMETVFMTQIQPKMYVRYNTGAEMFDVSRNEFIKLAQEAEAIHKHNGTTLVDPNEVRRYVEGLGAGR